MQEHRYLIQKSAVSRANGTFRVHMELLKAIHSSMGSLFKLIDVLQKDLHVPQVSNLLEQCFIYFLFTFALNTLQSPCICVLFLVKS